MIGRAIAVRIRYISIGSGASAFTLRQDSSNYPDMNIRRWTVPAKAIPMPASRIIESESRKARQRARSTGGSIREMAWVYDKRSSTVARRKPRPAECSGSMTGH